MNKILSYITLACMAAGFASCWSEDEFEAGAPRHQVTDLVAVPGDEEVELTWTMPSGWNPTDFLVTYTDADDQDITIRTSGSMTHLVTGLANGTQYTFGVQAVYGTLISQKVEAVTTPATTRFPVKDFAAETGSGYVFLSWTKPGTSVLDYTLKYYKESSPAEAETKTIAGEENTAMVEGLENDANYIFEITANYAKGASETVSLRAMPSEGTPYFVSSEYAVVGQPIKFTFNREDRPGDTDVTWTFPGGVELKGDEVEYAFTGANAETKVTLSANTGHRIQTWDIYINVREYGVYETSWEQDGTTYNGFKGTCPVFSPDGKTVYIITFNKVSALYAFDLVTGAKKWTYNPETKGGSYNMLTVNPVNGDIYYGTTTAGQFYCVTAEGELRWMFKGAQSMQAAAPAVNKAGDVVYICDNAGNVFAINANNGSQIWQAKAAAQGSGLLVNGNELVVGVQNAKAVSFLDAATGNVIKELTFAKGMTEISGFAVSNDRTKAYVPHKGGAMSLIDLNTHEVLVNAFTVANNDLYEPVVAPNGDVFVGSKNSHCYIIDGNLTAVKKDITTLVTLNGKEFNNGFNYSHPAVDNMNRYMIASGQIQNYNFIFDASGNVVDQWQDGSSSNQKQMGGNNFISGIFFSAYIGAGNDNGIFVGKYVGGERAASWSSHGGDQCGSCCVK
ncbi:MAG: fibronectin type III domain-containing protein [Clostridium sp.]|nr:fibronectin type III domain-containing protein [Clostridium sp.]